MANSIIQIKVLEHIHEVLLKIEQRMKNIEEHLKENTPKKETKQLLVESALDIIADKK